MKVEQVFSLLIFVSVADLVGIIVDSQRWPTGGKPMVGRRWPTSTSHENVPPASRRLISGPLVAICRLLADRRRRHGRAIGDVVPNL